MPYATLTQFESLFGPAQTAALQDPDETGTPDPTIIEGALAPRRQCGYNPDRHGAAARRRSLEHQRDRATALATAQRCWIVGVDILIHSPPRAGPYLKTGGV